MSQEKIKIHSMYCTIHIYIYTYPLERNTTKYWQWLYMGSKKEVYFLLCTVRIYFPNFTWQTYVMLFYFILFVYFFKSEKKLRYFFFKTEDKQKLDHANFTNYSSLVVKHELVYSANPPRAQTCDLESSNSIFVLQIRKLPVRSSNWWVPWPRLPTETF